MGIKETYGRLNGENEIEYFTGSYIRVERKVLGKVRTVTLYNPTEEDMNSIGWYRVIDVDAVGTNELVGNKIYHYIGVEESDIVIGEQETPEN